MFGASVTETIKPIFNQITILFKLCMYLVMLEKDMCWEKNSSRDLYLHFICEIAMQIIQSNVYF